LLLLFFSSVKHDAWAPLILWHSHAIVKELLSSRKHARARSCILRMAKVSEKKNAVRFVISVAGTFQRTQDCAFGAQM
jgi:hypothetical protein